MVTGNKNMLQKFDSDFGDGITYVGKQLGD